MAQTVYEYIEQWWGTCDETKLRTRWS